VRSIRLLFTLLAALLAITIAPASAAAFTFPGEPPTAEATLGEPIVFSTTFSGDGSAPQRVELLVSAPGERAVTVLPAAASGAGGEWRATATLDGHVPPNTTFEFRFRIREPGGDTLGPVGRVTVTDERFEWRTLEGPLVRLHWYEGDDAFARRALDIGEAAITRASELLGVTETEPIDFFIYATTQDMYGALGPGTRENVGGQAHSSIRTMFGLIEPNEISSSWVDTLVAHELTHLVFDTATENPYRRPPRWLNEGVAVYLSEGYSQSWRQVVDSARRDGRLIPLDGLGGLFPTTASEFHLAYGESVSAVSFFVETHGEPTLWELVRSYAEGVSDDHAFTVATGADLAAFNAAWMESLGVEVPQPHGPRPAPPGPVPPGWQVEPGPTDGPIGQPTEPGMPGPTSRPTQGTDQPGTPPPTDDGAQRLVVLAGIGVVILLLALLLVAVVLRGRRDDEAPPPAGWG
jgi:hypothetical protein